MKSTKKNPKLNVKLLRRIQKHILEEPRRFFMDWFIAKGTPGKKDFKVTTDAWRGGWDLAKSVPACGTAACIAGWVNLFTGHKPNAYELARKELGITKNQAIQLFNSGLWPEPYDLRYEHAKTPRRRASIACKRIEHFIKTGE